MNIYTVIPRWLHMRGDLRGVKRDTKLVALRQLGVDVVVCLVRIPDPDLQGVDGLEYIHAPLSDAAVIDESQTLAIRDLVVRRIFDGHSVLVHCVEGKNRAGLVVSLVVAKLLGVPTSQALDIVRAARPGAVYNVNFERYLREG